jgi:hypothetical protein
MTNPTPLPTTERLAQALEALNDPNLAAMIGRARAGCYDEFKTDLTLPLVQLVSDLRAAGHPGMAQRVIDGEFDSTLEEGQEWMEKEGWAYLLGLADDDDEDDGPDTAVAHPKE